MNVRVYLKLRGTNRLGLSIGQLYFRSIAWKITVDLFLIPDSLVLLGRADFCF